MHEHHILFRCNLEYIDLLEFPSYGTILCMENKMCPICQKEFIENRKPQKYCSHTCYHISRRTRIPLDCCNCGKQFLIPQRDYKAAKNKSRLCCSHKCRSILSKITKTCLICEREFSISKGLSKQKYCSRECLYKSYKIKKICPACKKEFLSIRSLNTKYCSMPCYRIIQRVDKVQKNCAICDAPFITTNKLVATGRGLYCSRECYNRSPTVSYGKAGFRQDLDHFCRSMMEANFGRILKYMGIIYEYESDRFDVVLGGRNLTYTPDFKLSPTFYVETKGEWRTEEAREKVIAFKKQYPHIKLHIIENPVYKKYLKRYKAYIPEFEGI